MGACGRNLKSKLCQGRWGRLEEAPFERIKGNPNRCRKFLLQAVVSSQVLNNEANSGKRSNGRGVAHRCGN